MPVYPGQKKSGDKSPHSKWIMRVMIFGHQTNRGRLCQGIQRIQLHTSMRSTQSAESFTKCIKEITSVRSGGGGDQTQRRSHQRRHAANMLNDTIDRAASAALENWMESALMRSCTRVMVRVVSRSWLRQSRITETGRFRNCAISFRRMAGTWVNQVLWRGCSARRARFSWMQPVAPKMR